MTIKRIQIEDVLGDKFYTYDLTSNNYSPSLNDTITINCTLKNSYGSVIPNISLALYRNGNLVGNATTNVNGIATWSVSCVNKGLQIFSVENVKMGIIVDNMTFTDYKNDLSARDSTSEFLKELDNLILAITGRGDL